MIASWLKQHLVDIGAWNADGCSRSARVRLHHCGAYVVHGLDDARCAWPAITDTDPISAAGEAIAILTGRLTYNLIRTGTRIELDHRNQFKVAGSPPGRRDFDVVAAHVCAAAPLPALPTAYTAPTIPKETADAPPY